MATTPSHLKSAWQAHYANTPAQLANMRGITGAASVFNANIDAVRKVKPGTLLAWIHDRGGDPAAF